MLCSSWVCSVLAHSRAGTKTGKQAAVSPVCSIEPGGTQILAPACVASEGRVEPYYQHSKRRVSQSLAVYLNTAHVCKTDTTSEGSPVGSDGPLGSVFIEPACSAGGGCMIRVPKRAGPPRVNNVPVSGLIDIAPTRCHALPECGVHSSSFTGTELGSPAVVTTIDLIEPVGLQTLPSAPVASEGRVLLHR